MEATLAKPAVAGTAGLLVFLLGGFCLRNLRFEWLAWRPGHIHVADFKLPATRRGIDVAWLTGVFRARVTQLSLQAPAPVPGAAAEGAYLDILSNASLDARNPLTLLRLGRALWPTHAYRVEATLQVDKRRSKQPYSILVQVSRLPNGSSTLVRKEGASWEQAIRRVADEATALILPRTRFCRRQWLSWRGYVMPNGLLHAYERAVELEAKGDKERAHGDKKKARRSYDDALRRYERALDKDPFNLAIRLRMGQLQERTCRPLQALAAYQGIVTVTLPAGEPLPRSLYSWRVRHERRRVITIARYRRAVILGGDELAARWLDREAGASAVRENLGRLLQEEASARAYAFVWEPERPGFRPAKRRLRTPSFESGIALWRLRKSLPYDPFGRLPDDSFGRNPPSAGLRAAFAALGYAMTQELQNDRHLRIRLAADRIVRWLPPFVVQRLPQADLPSAPQFTLKALLLAEVCIQLRLARALAELGILGSDWHGEAHAITGRVWQLMGGRVRQWHEGYNAACACGIPLDYDDTPNTEHLAREALQWLERATACADSAFVAGEDEWLEVDPDLKGVRKHPAYRLWRSVYFPDSSAASSALVPGTET